MNVAGYLLFGFAVFILAAGIVIVVRGRRAELEKERASAHSLEAMARALNELQTYLSSPEEASNAPEAIAASEESRSAHGVETRSSELEQAVHDHEVLQVRLMIDRRESYVAVSEWSTTAAHLMRAREREADSVVDFWQHLTRDASHGPSYGDVLGPVFGDALTHAAKLGVVAPEQAEVLKEWADSTSAIIRTPRGKRQAIDSRGRSIVSLSERVAIA